jgi:hypothetical protein
MTDYETAVSVAAVVDFEAGAYLPDHFAECGIGDLRIVGSVAAEVGECGVGVFVVGQVDVDKTFEVTERVDAFVAAAVVDDDGVDSTTVDCLKQGRYMVKVGGGSDEAEERGVRCWVLGVQLLADEVGKRIDVGWSGGCRCCVSMPATDLVVLAIDAVEVAVGEEDVDDGVEGRFFAAVDADVGNLQTIGCTAVACGACTLDTALSWA